jgi:hypothetical protein
MLPIGAMFFFAALLTDFDTVEAYVLSALLTILAIVAIVVVYGLTPAPRQGSASSA